MCAFPLLAGFMGFSNSGIPAKGGGFIKTIEIVYSSKDSKEIQVKSLITSKNRRVEFLKAIYKERETITSLSFLIDREKIGKQNYPFTIQMSSFQKYEYDEFKQNLFDILVETVSEEIKRYFL